MPELDSRVARFSALEVLETQQRQEMPQAAADLIWSRRLLPVLARQDETSNPFGAKAPIIGAGDLTITYAECPPGTGPGLHAHRATFETFTVMKGRFAFEVSVSGEADDVSRIVLEPFDVFSVPPGLYRGFSNIGDEAGMLQVIITGGVHDRNDIVFAPSIAQALAGHGKTYLHQFKEMGLEFAAPGKGALTGDARKDAAGG
jgi:quercetin dioxygenase-like cupin family protein